MTKPGLLNKAVDNAALLALFALAGTAIVAKRKAAWWAGSKAYNVTTAVAGWGLDTTKSLAHFTFKEGAISGPTAAGILAGTATALSYKYSPVLVCKDLPIKSKEHFPGNHLFWIGVSTFALTAFAIRYSNGKLSSHQMTRGGALTYATLATISSIAGVTLFDKAKSEYNEYNPLFINYEQHLIQRAVEWFHTPSESELAQAFWAEKPAQQPAAEYLQSKFNFNYGMGESDQQRAAYLIEGYEGDLQVATLLNALYDKGDGVDAYYLKAIFGMMSKSVQEAQLEALHEDIRPIFFQNEEYQSEEREQELPREYYKYESTAHFGWNETAEMGLAAGALTGVVAFVSYFALKTLHAFGDAVPIVKGTLPAVMVMAPTYVTTKHFTKPYARRDKRWFFAPFVAAFFAGALLTPKVSSFVLANRISYKAAAGVSTSATLATFLTED
ncbi:MAG: hypothetical protein KDK64_01465 [Chlamydiia bacterium]|nr:hypothetical protein [Chlamydiia bacterium]